MAGTIIADYIRTDANKLSLNVGNTVIATINASGILSNTGTVLISPSGSILADNISSGNLNASLLTTGTVPQTRLPTGAILQVVQSYRTSFLSTTSATPVDILTASITPISTSSRIFIMASGLEGTYGGDGNSYSRHQLLRNSTAIYSGDGTGVTVGASAGRFGRQGDSYADQVVINYVDSPSTTSSITYKWQFSSPRGPSWTATMGGCPRANSFSGDTRSPCNLILMEIA